ncbi:sigma-70 family RNA polymerase sigma factor [Novosphingobium sp. AAP93]|uniref:sigma-70 family RNA polymerase sigma factor n=1 Tax=Novosphingobium sp. AAP93 TaxID=1523427 RepID=UPI0006B96591|nr:sigma-70 family RNA polymerase sigma factor [Novosphingobium sp. AAP93]
MKARREQGLDIVSDPDRVEASLWRRLRFEANERCREVLFTRYIPLARSLAAKYLRKHTAGSAERGDLDQFAYEGLLQALDRFNPLLGVPFSAFARPRIAGTISDGMARMSDVADQLGHMRRRRRERLASLDPTAHGGDALEQLADLAFDLAIGIMLDSTGIIETDEGADTRANVYEGLAWRQAQAALAEEIARLPESESKVIRHHYQNGLTFATIAEVLRLTRGRISQLHKSAVERLRHRLRHFRER